MAKIKERIAKMAMEKVIDKLTSNAIRETNQWIENSSPFSTDNKRDIRASEFKNKTNSGLDYGYNHPEMDLLEIGRPAQPITGKYIQNVKSHKRKTATRNVKVRKHRRTYTNQKPVLMPDGNWAIVSTIPAVQANPILQTVANKWFSEQNIIKELISTTFQTKV